jgi:hypothetical protein
MRRRSHRRYPLLPTLTAAYQLPPAHLVSQQAELGSEVPPGRGGAACVAIGGRRVLLFGGADRGPTPWGDWWLLELGSGGAAHWTKIAPVLNLSHK